MKKYMIIMVAILSIVLLLCGCNASNNDQSTDKDILDINTISPEPDYPYQLWLSDDVILGTVIEERESRYSNPDGTLEGIANAWITPYVLQAETSYKGLFKAGEKITVNAWNYYGPKEEESFYITGNTELFRLREGQQGIFMLATSLVRTESGEETYSVLFGKEGVFESGTDAAGNRIYASPSFEITPDRLPADIANANETYGDRSAVQSEI